MPLVSAHLGHWYASLLYVAPVAVIVIVLGCRAAVTEHTTPKAGLAAATTTADDRR